MDRQRPVSSVEAMRWNEDVERRRIEFHERRCAEDAMYRKAYEYLKDQERRIWEQTHKPLTEILAAEAEQRVHDEKNLASCTEYQDRGTTEKQSINDCIKEAAKPQQIKSHEEVLRERASINAYLKMSDAEKIAAIGNALAMGLIGMMFICPDALQRRMKEQEELKPYLDEIREADKLFRNELVRLSGFEW